MAVTRIKSNDIGDSQVLTADIADSNVTFSKLQLATNPALEDSTGIRVKCDPASSIVRTSDGLAQLLLTDGGLVDASLGMHVRGFRKGVGTFNAAGDTNYETGTQRHQVYDGIEVRQLRGTLAAKTTSSQVVSSTTSETFFNTDQQYVIPANWFKAGRHIRITAWGKYGLDASGTPTMTLRMNMGSVNLMDTGGQNPLTSASLNRNWRIVSDVYCITDGSSGTVMFGTLTSLPTTLSLPNSVNGTTLNTTSGATVAVSVQFSASSGTNRAQMLGLLIEGA